MKTILSFILLIGIMSCSAQNKDTTATLKRMAKLDNKSFDEIQVNGEANFTLQNGNIVRQVRIRDTYIERIKVKDTPFSLVNTYSKSNTAIQSSVKHFYHFPIGIEKIYDLNGNIIKEVNYDQLFHFSIDDIALKVKNEFNIDIMKDNKNVRVARGSNPEYEVSFPIDPNANTPYGDKRVLIIDGNTGTITSNTIRIYTK